jgi:heat shock protein HslJ
MKPIYCFTLFLSCLILFSCTSSEKSLKVKSIPLEGTNWNLYQIDGKAYSFEKKITLNFKESDVKLTGEAPCNNYLGRYTHGGDIIILSQIASTKKMCPDLEIETKYLSLLQSTSKFIILGTSLNLYDSSGKLILVFTSK